MKTFVFVLVLAVLALLFDKWVFESVMSADWPDWVKYMILG